MNKTTRGYKSQNFHQTSDKNFVCILTLFIISKFLGCAPVEQSVVHWTVKTNDSYFNDLFLQDIKKYGSSIGLDELVCEPINAFRTACLPNSLLDDRAVFMCDPKPAQCKLKKYSSIFPHLAAEAC